jgi:cysteine desulfurase
VTFDMAQPVYLDYNATTPVDPRVLERMLPYFTSNFGNASSRAHPAGWAASEAVQIAREQVAGLIGSRADEIVFTSGATEALNLAIKGAAAIYSGKGRHVVTIATEHAAVLDTCRALRPLGFDITVLPVSEDGTIAPEAVADALRPDTILVAMMWANNETGVVHPVEEVARVVRAHGTLFLTDATQACGKIPVDVAGIDLLALSAHKMYGPKGAGALFVRKSGPRVRLAPLIDGGGQESGYRSGTLNVPGIVGLGAAADLAGLEMPEESSRLRTLRDRLETTLKASGAGQVRVSTGSAERLPQTSSLSFGPGTNVIQKARDLAISAGSACSSGSGRPSHVLKAMGMSDPEALATVRVSLGRFTTEEDVKKAIDSLTRAASRA